jgi:hypothetical protein
LAICLSSQIQSFQRFQRFHHNNRQSLLFEQQKLRDVLQKPSLQLRLLGPSLHLQVLEQWHLALLKQWCQALLK